MNTIRIKKFPPVARFLLFFGLSHAVVDAACALLLLGLLAASSQFSLYLVLYNVLAFGLQAPFGFLLDRYKYPRLCALLGMAFVALAFFCLELPLPAVILLGIGNALFHVGGGQLALQLKEHKAVYAGIFVAPGGIGLALGAYLAMKTASWSAFTFSVVTWGLPCLLLLLGSANLFTPLPQAEVTVKTDKKADFRFAIIMLLLLSIAVRSVIGLTTVFPWKSDVWLLAILAVAIAGGKIMGGVLGDRFGWSKVGGGGLLISIPLLISGVSVPVAGIIGMFCFNLTMPITLVAISVLLPGRAGLAFGLTTCALLLGALPSFSSMGSFFAKAEVVVSLVIVSAAALFVALRLIRKKSGLVSLLPG